MPGDVYGFHRFGSAGLAKLLMDEREHLIANIHGHCHDGAFLDNVRGEKGAGNTFPVVNPGSLHQHEYGTLTLDKVDGKWRVAAATKKYV